MRKDFTDFLLQEKNYAEFSAKASSPIDPNLKINDAVASEMSIQYLSLLTSRF
jgi:hypothetical protein